MPLRPVPDRPVHLQVDIFSRIISQLGLMPGGNAGGSHDIIDANRLVIGN
jgi:hypothetical protein